MTYMPLIKQHLKTSEPSLHISSSELENDLAYIKNNTMRTIDVNDFYDYEIDNIDWLEQVGNIVRKLTISVTKAKHFSYSGLKYCKQLRSLTIQNYTKDIIDVSHNTQLVDFYTLNSQYVDGFERLKSLKNLVLTKPTNYVLTPEVFEKFSKLEYLCLSGRDFLDGVEFLANSPLTKLMFSHCRKVSLKGIEALNLEWLEIDSCKSLEYFEKVFDISSLKELRLLNSVRVASPHQLDKLQNLEILVLLGTSYFKDGNLDPLKGRLRHLGIDKKRHYSISPEEFREKYCISRNE